MVYPIESIARSLISEEMKRDDNYKFLKNMNYEKGSFLIDKEYYPDIIENMNNKLKNECEALEIDDNGHLYISDEHITLNSINEFAKEWEPINQKIFGGHCLLNSENRYNNKDKTKTYNADDLSFDVYKEIKKTIFHKGHILARNIVERFPFQKSTKNRRNIFPIAVWTNKPNNEDKYGYNMTYYENKVQEWQRDYTLVYYNVELIYENDEDEIPKLIFIKLVPNKEVDPIFAIIPNIDVIDYSKISANKRWYQ